MRKSKRIPEPEPVPASLPIADLVLVAACAFAVVYARKLPSDHHLQRATVLTLLIAAAGARMFMLLEDNSTVDSIYFVACTLSSIGYGNITPTKGITRLFVCALLLVGMGAFGALTEAFGKWRARGLTEAGLSDGPSAAVATLAALLAIGTPVFMVTEGQAPLDAMYFTFITMTTVGYGDLAPTTQAGRLALSVFSVVALAPMAFVTTVFAEVLTRALSGPGPDAAGVAKKAA